MKFAQNSAETTDWYLSDRLTDEDFATMTTAFFPPTEHQLDEHRPHQVLAERVLASTASATRRRSTAYNREVAKRERRRVPASPPRRRLHRHGRRRRGGPGGNERRGLPQVQLQGRRHARAAGMGGNPEMMADLMPDMAGGTGGRRSAHLHVGQRRAAACRWPTGPALTWRRAPVAGMNMKGLSLPGKMNCLPQAVWIDENGKPLLPTSTTPLPSSAGTRPRPSQPQDEVRRGRRQLHPVPPVHPAPARRLHAPPRRTSPRCATSLDKAYAKFKGTYEEPGAGRRGRAARAVAAP